MSINGACGEGFHSKQSVLQGCAWSNPCAAAYATAWAQWVEPQAEVHAYSYADDWYFLVDRFALRAKAGTEEARQAEREAAKLEHEQRAREDATEAVAVASAASAAAAAASASLMAEVESLRARVGEAEAAAAAAPATTTTSTHGRLTTSSPTRASSLTRRPCSS